MEIETDAPGQFRKPHHAMPRGRIDPLPRRLKALRASVDVLTMTATTIIESGLDIPSPAIRG